MKNNGGRVSFQTKRAQQVSCVSIVVVHIVLCSEIYTTAPERSRVLNDRRTNTAQDRSVELCKPVLDSMNFSPLLMGKLAFHFLDHISKPNFVRERGLTLQGQLTDTPTSINREAPNRWKKIAAKACDSLVGTAASSLLAAIFDRKKST